MKMSTIRNIAHRRGLLRCLKTMILAVKNAF